MNGNLIRILIADDHEFVRLGIESVVHRCRPHWEIVAKAVDGLQAAEMAEALHPDLLVLDLAMPELNGMAVLERLAQTAPRTRVMVLTVHPGTQLMRTAKKLGARAYISKNESPSNIVVAMDRVMADEPFFSSDVFGVETGSPAESGAYLPSQYLLTSRELEVLRTLALGRTNKETALWLGMSVRTAESHRANILHKLGAASIGELVRIALRDGVA